MNHKLSIAGYLVGIFIIISSTIRWWFIFHDLSNFLFAVSIGGLVCILAYIYNYMRETDETINKMKMQIQGMVSMWTHNEQEDIKSIAKGLDIQ